MTSDDVTHRCGCKVGRSASRYGLVDLDETLRTRRVERGDSLRDLAAQVNRRILGAAIERADGIDVEEADPLYGALDDREAISTIFEALVDEDAPASRGARVRTRLEQAGVDVPTVEGDFVTHPTVRNHLRRCLDIETSSSSAIDADEATDTVEWARRRCASVVEQTFRRLRSAGVVSTGDLNASVTIRLSCPGCGETYSPAGLLERGRCECRSNDN